MGKNEIEGGFYPRRILVVQLRQVGDAIMCTPAIRALRRAFPESRIDFLGEPPAASALARNPNIAHIIVSEAHSWVATLRIISEIRATRYDLVIDYLANPTSAIIARLSGASVTLSYSQRRRSRFYSHTVVPTGQYSAEHKLSLLEALNVGSIHELPLQDVILNTNLKPDFYLSEKAKSRIGDWLQSIGLTRPPKAGFVLIDPTHRRVTRRYTHYAEVARLLKSKLGVPCVFVWGPGEEEEVRAIYMQSGNGHFIAPKTNLEELGALIGHASLLIGNDSAPRHIAAALDTPTVIVTGSTRPENWTFPSPIHRTIAFDIECRPCEKNTCPRGDLACMTQLDPEKVFNEIAFSRQLIKL